MLSAEAPARREARRSARGVEQPRPSRRARPPAPACRRLQRPPQVQESPRGQTLQRSPPPSPPPRRSSRAQRRRPLGSSWASPSQSARRSARPRPWPSSIAGQRRGARLQLKRRSRRRQPPHRSCPRRRCLRRARRRRSRRRCRCRQRPRLRPRLQSKAEVPRVPLRCVLAPRRRPIVRRITASLTSARFSTAPAPRWRDARLHTRSRRSRSTKLATPEGSCPPSVTPCAFWRSPCLAIGRPRPRARRRSVRRTRTAFSPRSSTKRSPVRTRPFVLTSSQR